MCVHVCGCVCVCVKLQPPGLKNTANVEMAKSTVPGMAAWALPQKLVTNHRAMCKNAQQQK